jgi:5-methylthioadenosine/S-adenosylhomocysteine deaminase
LTDRKLVSMATRVPASIVKWESLVGSLDPGKRADLLIVDAPPDTEVYAGLIAARETAVELVVIDGRAVFGEPALMSLLGAGGETLTVGGQPRSIDLTFPRKSGHRVTRISPLPAVG